jgi:hypothetical protein
VGHCGVGRKRVQKKGVETLSSGIGAMPGGGGGVALMALGPDHSLVLRTNDTLFALLFGFIGGVTARWFYLTRSPLENERRPG